MRIVAVDVFENKLSELVYSLQTIFPDDEVVPFTDPFFAARYGVEHRVDMLFTEILMHGLGGLTVASMIRTSNKNVLVFFIADTDEYKEEAKEIDYSGFLVRPVTGEAIREILTD